MFVKKKKWWLFTLLLMRESEVFPTLKINTMLCYIKCLAPFSAALKQPKCNLS